MLENFVYRVCGCTGAWTMSSFIEAETQAIRERVGHRRVLCALSGGVDSSVVALLVHRAIGDQLTCIFIDNGMLRGGEAAQVEATFRDHFNIHLVTADAAERNLTKLSGITDPEQKRKIIGHEFVEAFREEARRSGPFDFLAQGTLYPDVIESVPVRGNASALIKSHHNVGGLPKDLGLTLVEPLRDLYKDEVRKVARELGLTVAERQPFPGPGLAVRVLGDVTPEKVAIVREACAIVEDEIEKAHREGLIGTLPWQYFAALLPVRSVGVQGDIRAYGHTIAVRAVASIDAMTATAFNLPHEVLGRLSRRITNAMKDQVNRVVYDVTDKPPGTVEWE
jgi:GMP synthase (glutamine-hydrolysing)